MNRRQNANVCRDVHSQTSHLKCHTPSSNSAESQICPVSLGAFDALCFPSFFASLQSSMKSSSEGSDCREPDLFPCASGTLQP